MENGRLRKALIMTSLGNTVEWFDFTIFGAMAVILTQLFFPQQEPLSGLIYTFGIFGSGFLMRPLGGIFFGHIGDRIGRRSALLWSIGLMSLAIFLMGCIPTALQVGLTAPLLLTLMRLVQGFSVGGEFTGTISFLAEIAPTRHRGLVGSLALMGVVLGVLVGDLILAILPNDLLASWGWRIPFWLGGLFGLFVLFMRRQLPETEVFEHEKEEAHLEKIPLLEALVHHPWAMVKAFLMTIMLGVAFYIVLFYMRTYFTLGLGLEAGLVSTISFGATIFLFILIPIAGALGDGLGRRILMIVSSLGFLLLSWPLVKLQLDATKLVTILFTHGLIVFFLAFYGAPLCGALPELFETRYRYSGLSTSYNLAQAVFGGTAPIVAALLVKGTGDYSTLTYTLIVAAIFALSGLFFYKEVRGPLPD